MGAMAAMRCCNLALTWTTKIAHHATGGADRVHVVAPKPVCMLHRVTERRMGKADMRSDGIAQGKLTFMSQW